MKEKVSNLSLLFLHPANTKLMEVYKTPQVMIKILFHHQTMYLNCQTMPPYLHDLYTNETKTGERTTGNIFEFHNFNTLHYHINPLITIIALRDQCTIF